MLTQLFANCGFAIGVLGKLEYGSSPELEGCEALGVEKGIVRGLLGRAPGLRAIVAYPKIRQASRRASLLRRICIMNRSTNHDRFQVSLDRPPFHSLPQELAGAAANPSVEACLLGQGR